MLRVGDPRSRVVLQRRRLASAQRSDDSGEQDRERVPAGVDHAGVTKHRQQIRSAPDRILTGVERAFDHLGDNRVLLLGGGVGAEPCVSLMCARSEATRTAISRTTVRIVPSAGSRTEP